MYVDIDLYQGEAKKRPAEIPANIEGSTGKAWLEPEEGSEIQEAPNITLGAYLAAGHVGGTVLSQPRVGK